MRRSLKCYSESSAILTRDCEVALERTGTEKQEIAHRIDAGAVDEETEDDGQELVFDEENASGTLSRLSKTPIFCHPADESDDCSGDERRPLAARHLDNLVRRFDEVPKPRMCWQDGDEVRKRDSWLPLGYDGAEPQRASNDDLQEAALRGDLGLVRQLVHQGASVNAPMQPASDDEFMTLLHVLARKPEMPNGTRIMSEIISRKANLNVRSSIGMTPLSCACLSKHVGVVELLLDVKADTTPVDDYGRNAAHCAVRSPGDGAAGLKDMPGMEPLSVEIIELLASAGADLTDGGDVSPIQEAVRQLNYPAVVTLLDSGAIPEGLHEAMEKADKSMIQALIDAEANPFTRDAYGRTAMDMALARGDEEITTTLRDFIGDLQRKGHPHVKTLEDQMREEANDDMFDKWPPHPNKRNSIHKSLLEFAPVKVNESNSRWDHPRWLSFKEKIVGWCRRINRNKYFQLVMLSCLLLALFLPDLWVIFDIASNDPLDVILIMILLAFITEFLVQIIGLHKSYTFSFFFWMDLVGVFSVPLDHSLVVNALPMSLDNAVVMRAARMAKLGARAGRFTKLIKLLRFLPGMSQHDFGTARVISNSLNLALSTRVSCLIIVMVMVLPLFELATYPENDYSMRMWVDQMHEVASTRPSSFAETLADFEAFYDDEAYYPFEVHCVFANGSSRTQQLSKSKPVRQRNRIQINALSGEGEAYAKFNFRAPNQISALCNSLLIVTIIILMLGSGLILSNSVSAIVLVPLEQLLSNVKKVASKIFKSVTTMAGRGSQDFDDEDNLPEDEADAGAAFGSETSLLEKVLKKLATLSEITVNKSPIDAETFKQLGESDRAMLAGYSDAPQRGLGLCQAEASAWEVSTTVSSEMSVDDIHQNLIDVDLTWDELEMWDFDVLGLNGAQRNAVVHCLLVFQHGNLAGGSSSSDWGAACSGFVDVVAKSYSDPRQVPYHSWAHAADVTFTLFRALHLGGTSGYLSALERFALLVSASCHDIGHAGLNNAFLTETSHELAIRYNDQSPLQSMHAARLFEIVRTPASDIFSEIEQAKYRELRHLCIEAILSSDFQHHFNMMKELQTLFDMNTELFYAADDLYRKGSESLSRGVLEFFRGTEVKKQVRGLFLHFSDISNPMKPFEMCRAWSELTAEEFFLQGDREKALGIPVHPMNDRGRTNTTYAQMGFIEFFVAPFAIATVRLLPTMTPCAEMLLENFQEWRTAWVQESNPKPDSNEQARVLERLRKLELKLRTREKAHRRGSERFVEG